LNNLENSEHSDEALIGLLKSDHASALKEIFNRFNIRLFRLASSVIQNEDIAKDIVQEVFIDLWNRRHSSDIQSLNNYLITAIKFQSLKHLRNGQLQERHLKLIQNIQFVNQTEESLNFKELDDSLRSALEELPPRCKAVFQLSRFENLSHKEIASKLGITSKTVEVQIHKALLVLRKRLDKAIVLVFASLIF
ncbi:MAG TPA: RNA polymerase sigma-70 factor, partial [Chryseolinea sp.]|nr:RNA polymerase sigma-70 factor [Chryseolinea sp.]